MEKRRLEVEFSDAQAKNRKVQEDISIVTASSLYWKNRFKSIVRRVMEQNCSRKQEGRDHFLNIQSAASVELNMKGEVHSKTKM